MDRWWPEPGAESTVVSDELFCSNADCVLHVRAGDPGVCGRGEWALRPDGVLTSRGVYGGRVMCDVCGRTGGSVGREEEA